MSIVPTATGRESREIRHSGRAPVFCLLLGAALAVPAAPGFAGMPAAPAPSTPTAAEALPAGGMPPLEHLVSTIGDLKASLSAIRQDLAAMHADAVAIVQPDQVGTLPAAGQRTQLALARELEEARARADDQRAARQHAEAAMTGELTGLRERLAAADAAVAQLREDREALVRRIIELDQMVQKTKASQVVDASVGAQRPAIERAAAEPQVLQVAGLMRVTQPALAAEAPPGLKLGDRDQLARAGSRLDLQAELALAQLRIAELTTALDSARLREEAKEAELTGLRSLTEAQIRSFMGRE